MGLMDTALAVWISFHTNLGVELEHFFNDGVSKATLEQTEATLGYPLPEDLKALYEKTNGQKTALDDDQTHLNNAVWAPMFGNYYFYTIEKALEEYEFLVQMYASDPELMESEWEVRGNDPVTAIYGDLKRFPFAGDDNGNMYMVDMNPPSSGTSGQVILQGADQSKISVLSSSVSQFMLDAASKLDALKIRKLSYLEQAEPSVGLQLLYFETDWRETPFYEILKTQQLRDLEYDKKLKVARRDYDQWRQQKGVDQSSLKTRQLDMLDRMIDRNLLDTIGDHPATEEDVSYFITQVIIQRNVTHSSEYDEKDRVIEKSINDLYHLVEFQVERGKWMRVDSERINKAITMFRNPYSEGDSRIIEELLKR